LERKTCRATRLIWRRKSRAITPIGRGKPAVLTYLFGEKNMQYYQTYEKKTYKNTKNRQSYQTFLEKKTYRATRLIWRRKSAELSDLFGEEKLESYVFLSK
jgi:hypothetical protein